MVCFLPLQQNLVFCHRGVLHNNPHSAIMFSSFAVSAAVTTASGATNVTGGLEAVRNDGESSEISILKGVAGDNFASLLLDSRKVRSCRGRGIGAPSLRPCARTSVGRHQVKGTRLVFGWVLAA